MQVRVHGRTPTLDRHDGTKGKKIPHPCNACFLDNICMFRIELRGLDGCGHFQTYMFLLEKKSHV